VFDLRKLISYMLFYHTYNSLEL